MRRLDFNWVQYRDLKTFMNNLPATDYPSHAYINQISRTYNYNYYTTGFFEIRANREYYVRIISVYNNSNGGMVEPNNDDGLKGSITWFVD